MAFGVIISNYEYCKRTDILFLYSCLEISKINRDNRAILTLSPFSVLSQCSTRSIGECQLDRSDSTFFCTSVALRKLIGGYGCKFTGLAWCSHKLQYYGATFSSLTHQDSAEVWSDQKWRKGGIKRPRPSKITVCSSMASIKGRKSKITYIDISNCMYSWKTNISFPWSHLSNNGCLNETTPFVWAL
jgi:hypothetical protein